MQDSMLSGLFGALTTEHRLNNIANNLANVNTNGYKRDVLAFKDTMALFAHDEIMEPMANVRSKKLFPEPLHVARPRIAVARTDFSQGSFHYTSDPLDLAISGNGFFKVRTPEGEFYTRNGHFRQTSDGQLVTMQGWPVVSEGGDINLPQGKNLQVASDGRIAVDGVDVGQLQVGTVSDLEGLEKLGGNLYRLREGSTAGEVPVGPDVIVSQGYIETSNVEVVNEMVNMIETQRQFEAYQKVMQTSDTVDRDAITKIGRGR